MNHHWRCIVRIDTMITMHLITRRCAVVRGVSIEMVVAVLVMAMVGEGAVVALTRSQCQRALFAPRPALIGRHVVFPNMDMTVPSTFPSSFWTWGNIRRCALGFGPDIG